VIPGMGYPCFCTLTAGFKDTFSGRKRKWVKPNERVVKRKYEGVKCR